MDSPGSSGPIYEGYVTRCYRQPASRYLRRSANDPPSGAGRPLVVPRALSVPFNSLQDNQLHFQSVEDRSSRSNGFSLVPNNSHRGSEGASLRKAWVTRVASPKRTCGILFLILSISVEEMKRSVPFDWEEQSRRRCVCLTPKSMPREAEEGRNQGHARCHRTDRWGGGMDAIRASG